MKNFLLVLLLLFLSQEVLSQNEIIAKDNISGLNKIIDSLEKEYNTSPKNNIESLPQGTGDYFEVKTKKPDEFISALINNIALDSLISKFPNLQIDRDLLVLKNQIEYSNGEKKIEIKSFQIKNNRDHRITIEYSDSLEKENIQFYYTTYTNKKSNITNIRGFNIKESFSKKSLPQKYADWVLYTDNLVLPGEKLFFNTNNKAVPRYITEKTIIDSLINYYALKTNKPQPSKDQDFIAFQKIQKEWEDKRSYYSDSLFKNDSEFKELLIQSIEYAENEKKSNGELEYFTANLISQEKALKLMRFNQQVGSCSFDNGPIIQQKRMANLAAEIPNWSVFIKSFLNVMNDNVSRIANSNIASNSRKTYIEELTKLNIDIPKLLLGSNLRIDNDNQPHYFSNGSKIGKAFSSLDEKNQAYFEKTVSDLIQDKNVDAFNKLHFYNTLKHYQYFIKDSIKKNELELKITSLEKDMPDVLQSRFENPNKELKDLLKSERKELEKFEILDISIGNIYSYSYGGDCWVAELRDKNENNKIIYDLIMPIEDSITPLKNFLNKKDDLTSRIEDNDFVTKLLNTNPENELYIKFTGDKSFSNFRNRVLKEMPENLQNLNYDNAISFYISYPNRKYVRYILLENNNVIILGIPKGFEIPGYSFEDLLTETEENFLSKSYKSFKVFNEQGEMIN